MPLPMAHLTCLVILRWLYVLPDLLPWSTYGCCTAWPSTLILSRLLYCLIPYLDLLEVVILPDPYLDPLEVVILPDHLLWSSWGSCTDCFPTWIFLRLLYCLNLTLILLRLLYCLNFYLDPLEVVVLPDLPPWSSWGCRTTLPSSLILLRLLYCQIPYLDPLEVVVLPNPLPWSAWGCCTAWSPTLIRLRLLYCLMSSPLRSWTCSLVSPAPILMVDALEHVTVLVPQGTFLILKETWLLQKNKLRIMVININKPMLLIICLY